MPTYKINGRTYDVEHEEEVRLLWLLRDYIGLTGTKYGCGETLCGSCTVLVNGEPQRSCVMSPAIAQSSEITTIEGLAQGDKLHPVQEAFIKNEAFQCGFCTAGMIMQTVALLKRTPDPTEEQIVDALNQNICRCCTYPRIVAAVKDAAMAMKGARQ